MRQALGEYDDRDEGFGLVGEERAEEPLPRDRRLPMVVLTVFAMALFAGGLWFAYVQGTRHPTATTARGGGDGVPLLRADEHPSKVKPDQPGGMTIPDQNVSLYNERSGGPPVEKLLPTAEQPMPRPTAAPPEPAPAQPPAAPSASTAPQSPSPPAAAPTTTHAPAPAPAKAAAKAAPPPAAKTAAQPKEAASVPTAGAPAPGKAGPVQIRLASLRTPEAAREEWAKLKRDNPDLLGKLTAVAVRTDLGDKGIFYRIEAGSFADAAAAERLCGELKRRNLGCLLAR